MSKRFVLCAGIAALATPALAEKPDVVLSADGMVTKLAGAPDKVAYSGGLFDPAGCPAIFDTAEAGNDGCSGWTIIDANVFGFTQYPGNAFVPDETVTVCSIELSAGHVTGVNSYRVILYGDAGNTPDCSNMLGEWSIGALDPFDCVQDTPKSTGDISGDGVVLTGGTQYWVLVYTSDPSSGTWGATSFSLDGTTPLLGGETDSGCVNFGNATAAAWTVYAAPGGGGPSINVGGSCPGTVTVNYSGFTPNTQVGIVFASNTGSFVIPSGPCAGTQLGLGSSNIQLVNIINSGSGSGQVQGQAGVGACGGFLQFVESGSCATSNVDQLP